MGAWALLRDKPPRLHPERAPRARFVGRATCASCHAAQHEAWRGSHHDLAMQPANDATVLGDFRGSSFEADGVRAVFLRRGGKHLVRIDGPDGEVVDLPVEYVLGVDPLQQLLVGIGRGRYQALTVAWDSRPAERGGQRWFHLYPGERIDRAHPLHWTALSQNWNFMCAECHSTDLVRGYRPGEDRYETTWAEIDVSCEACHGPGRRHVEWARAGASLHDPAKGLEVLLPAPCGWEMDAARGIARRTTPVSRTEVETCARCHSRRTPITARYRWGRLLADTHRPALLDEGLYFADGQQLDEVYEYGSFVQSKMFAAGVTCSDCHDAHAVRRVEAPDALCARCHLADRFAVPAHHHHAPRSRGSSCLDCHMPARNYMVVDVRRDHGFRVPRPDLTAQIGTPNACDDCHADRGAAWAADRVLEWRGRPAPAHWTRAIDAGRRGLPEADAMLGRLVRDEAAPAIARATALGLLGSSPLGLQSALRGLGDRDPIVRAAAARALEQVAPSVRLRRALPLLDDPIALVRIDAAAALLSAPPAMARRHGRALATAADVFREAQMAQAERPEARVNLGWLEDRLGQADRAVAEYREAIELGPHFVPAYVDLADLHRRHGREREAEGVLRRGLGRVPDSTDLHRALGLLQVRTGRRAQALASLARAAELAPEDPRAAYALGLALRSAGRFEEAARALERAHHGRPADRPVLLALAGTCRDAGRMGDAVGWARKLLELDPSDAAARRLVEELEEASRTPP